MCEVTGIPLGYEEFLYRTATCLTKEDYDLRTYELNYEIRNNDERLAYANVSLNFKSSLGEGSIGASLIRIDLIETEENYRNKDYATLLLQEILKDNPQVTDILGQSTPYAVGFWLKLNAKFYETKEQLQQVQDYPEDYLTFEDINIDAFEFKLKPKEILNRYVER